MAGFLAVVGSTTLGAIALVVAAELSLRLWGWIQKTYLVEEIRRQDFLDEAYHPYINWTDSWDKAMFRYIPAGFRVFNNANPVAAVTNNRLGFRTYDLDRAVDEQALRIVLMGGSAAWGFGASSNQATIAGALENLANADGEFLQEHTRAVVYNLAQVNQTQTQDLILAMQLLPWLRPHVVVQFNGWNELVASITMDATLVADFDLFPMNEMVDWEPMAIGDNWRKALRDALASCGRRRSRLLARMISSPPTIQFRRSVKDNVALMSPIFVRNIDRFVVLSRGLGFKYFNFLQPNLYGKRHLTEPEAKALELYDRHRPMLGGEENGNFLRSNDVYSDVMASAQQHSTAAYVHNLSDIFNDEKRAMFFSLVHCRDAGYAAIASKIFDVVKKNRRMQ